MKNTRGIRVLMIVLGALLVTGSVSGQVGKEGPVKFDEFGHTNHEDYSARLDNIAIALQADLTVKATLFFIMGGSRCPAPP